MNYKTAILAGLMVFNFMSHATEPKSQSSSTWSFSNTATWALGGLTAAMSAKSAYHYIMRNRWHETCRDNTEEIGSLKKLFCHAAIKDACLAQQRETLFYKCFKKKLKECRLSKRLNKSKKVSDLIEAIHVSKEIKDLRASLDENITQRALAQKCIDKEKQLKANQEYALRKLISEDTKHREAFSCALMPAFTLEAILCWKSRARAA